MDTLIQKALQQAAALRKDPASVPWKADEPWAQPYHGWSPEREAWEPIQSSPPQSAGGLPADGTNTIVLFSWNIDVLLPFAEPRMKAALAHLQVLAEQPLLGKNSAVVIFLQECSQSDLATIGQNQWIRDRFYVTDVDDSAWASGAYGTTTLIDRRLEITSSFRVHYSMSQMERDALFVDLIIPAPSGPGKIVRFCNTHLESFVADPPLRPPQLKLAAKYMHAEGVASAVVAGDFNAIQPLDEFLHSDNGLKDAYLELGGQRGAAEGYTWGQQALPVLRQRFGCSRMDRVYFCGDGLRLLNFERFGADVEVDEAETAARDELLSFGFEKPWITDHLGVKAVFNWPSEHHL
ncbi:hypothetical protein HJFPF1_08264 [Paramyrothecium foliicola]|nr:hypothetical protein HJFPF1_08264 [Paramyrothecium foliicola]